MNVLQVLPALGGGGVEEDTLALALYLKQTEAFEPQVASNGGPLVARLQNAHIPHHPLPLHLKNPVALWRNAHALMALCWSQKIDLLHVHSRGPAWSALWATRRLKIPMVATFHSAYGASNGFKRYYTRAMLSGKVTIAISPFIERHVVDTYGLIRGLQTIARGVDTQFFDPQHVTHIQKEQLRKILDLKDQRVVLLPGRPSPLKGHGEILESLLSVIKVHPNVCLVCPGVAGASSYVTSLNRFVVKHGLERHVRFVSYAADLRPFYALADWTLVVTRKPEGFGLVMAESSAMETPVMAFDWGGARDLIRHGETGLLTTQKGLVQGLVEALSLNEEKRARYGQNARVYMVAHYNIDVCHQKTATLYGRLLGQKTVFARRSAGA